MPVAQDARGGGRPCAAPPERPHARAGDGEREVVVAAVPPEDGVEKGFPDAAPARLVAAARRAAFMAPFYARAAVQLAVEDSARAAEAFKAESQRRVVSAPQQARQASAATY